MWPLEHVMVIVSGSGSRDEEDDHGELEQAMANRGTVTMNMRTIGANCNMP
jgi:hypothetical protein